MEEVYRYYFVKGRTIEKFITEMSGPNFEELTSEQLAFWKEHPEATVREVKKCELDPPYIPPVPSITELKEEALNKIDALSRNTIGVFVDTLTFSNAMASSVYAKAHDITPIDDDGKVLKTATDFLIIGRMCKELFGELSGRIETVETKAEIDEILEEAEERYGRIKQNEDSIEKHRIAKLQEIELYDTSDNVNSFIFNGHKMWLDKNTRMSLMNTLQLCEATGKETMDIWFGDVSYNLDIDTAKAFLTAIEMYAMDCYNVTATHRSVVKGLQTIEEIDSFDVTTDYKPNPVF